MFYVKIFVIVYQLIVSFTASGVFMRDVTLCNYGNPKKLKNGLFNFSKLRILVQMVSINNTFYLLSVSHSHAQTQLPHLMFTMSVYEFYFWFWFRLYT